MNIKELKEKYNKYELDFYSDFYNLMDETTKNNIFYQSNNIDSAEDVSLQQDIETLQPYEFFNKYFLTDNSLKKEQTILFELINTLQKTYIADSLSNLCSKWIIDDFSVEKDDEKSENEFNIYDYFFHTLEDEGWLINYEVDSIDDIFNDCISEKQFEEAIKSNIENEFLKI